MKRFDVVVIGGGFAGIAAALSSVREGKRTLLVESTYQLGGLATAGLISYYLPLCDGRGHRLMDSIPYELFLLSMSEGYEEKYPKEWMEQGYSEEDRIQHRLENKFNPNLFALLVERLLRKEGVEILFGASLNGANTKDGFIKSVSLVSRTENLKVEADAFVDATGDATLAHYAGEETVDVPFGNVPAYWYYAAEEGKHVLHQAGSTDFTPLGTGETRSIKGIDTQEVSDYIGEYHQFVLDDFLKGGKDSLDHSLGLISTIPLLRMTRRIKGQYDLAYEDDHRNFNSSLGLFGNWCVPGPIYELPAECLMGKCIKNLFVSGRCFGVKDGTTWNITRVIPVCALSGEAVGLLAAYIHEKEPIRKAQETLLSRGALLHAKEEWKK